MLCIAMFSEALEIFDFLEIREVIITHKIIKLKATVKLFTKVQLLPIIT